MLKQDGLNLKRDGLTSFILINLQTGSISLTKVFRLVTNLWTWGYI